MDKSKIVAVITGDINASSGLRDGEGQYLEFVLKSSYDIIKREYKGAQVAGFTTFRGDSWQFVVKKAPVAIHAAVFYKAAFRMQAEEQFKKHMHTSAAIGFGEVDYLPNQRTRAGGGRAYSLSGRRVDKLRRRMPGMGVAGLGDKQDAALDAVVGVIDALVHQWTYLQAQAVRLALRGYTQIEIAENWSPEPISQQAVNKHLNKSGWPAIEQALRWTEDTLRGCISDNNFQELSRGDSYAD